MGCQPFADLHRPAVLPHDRRSLWCSGATVPGQHGLTLVGQTDCGQRRVARLGERGMAGREHALPQLLGIELDAAVG